MAKKEKHQLPDELTTEMHAEFMEGEMTAYEMRICGVYGAMGRGLTKKEALERYELTEKEYDDNIDRVLSL